MTSKPYVLITLALTVLTFVLLKVGLSFQLANIALLFLLPVLFSAVIWGLRPSVYAAAVGVIAFDYFFVPPIFSFSVSDLRYLISFAVFLVVAILTATLASRLRAQVRESKIRELELEGLYDLSRQTTGVSDVDELVEIIVSHVASTLCLPVWIVLPQNEELSVHGSYEVGSEATHVDRKNIHVDRIPLDLELCRFVLQHGKVAGREMDDYTSDSKRYIPLQTESMTLGVFVVDTTSLHEGLIQQKQRLIDAFVVLSATTIARIRLGKEAQLARLSAESERLRTVLLDSISHELRTPLAGIIGSVTGMIEQERVLSAIDERELLFTIRDSAMRMNRLVTNLLGMVRIESGMLSLQRHVCDIMDILGVVFRQLQDPLTSRTVNVHMQPDLPSLYVDDVLIEQVLVNILSNAVKYSDEGSQIFIDVRVEDDVVVLDICDEGIGISLGDETKVFDKFYRSESAKRIPGTGLGLAICKGIIEAHGGAISAKRRGDYGTQMIIYLPIGEGEESDFGCQNSGY
ncbi:DUF4118 domain-containing protein [Sulfoacidibacillus ferrooxidans]|uniref:histidine kinase n=1 Tax=Sulfoacidibacillus ferrooxidans TaxID=2005001 RepID=A0A9X2ADU4_9BACL|nr:DUF4118 domain-containing protein [Sulfoacidibacillus ferrooxidans]MCI0182667.1 Sensor protein KdpD [Sulfoacidibacillus ferrooxidans]